MRYIPCGLKDLLFSPLFEEDEPILTIYYFSNLLVQPPTRYQLGMPDNLNM